MIETNYLTHVQFEVPEGPAGREVTFDLNGYIPGGVLDVGHLQMRTNAGTGGVWSLWGLVADGSPNRSYDPETNTVVLRLDQPSKIFVQFRRVTPRYVLLLDPLIGYPTTEPVLRSNASQGLFVAVELAAEAGINAYVLGDPPELPIGQARTQTRWPADHPFKQAKIYNFQFAGGYLAREHVRVQIKLDGVWTEYIIGEDNFVGPWQLRLDFSSVPGEITGLVIRRFTPRDGTVAVVEDGYVVGPRGLDPAARHAFYAAVEIGEDLQYALQVIPQLPFTLPLKDRLRPKVTFHGALADVGQDHVIQGHEYLSTSVTFSGTLDSIAAESLLPVEAVTVTVEFEGQLEDIGVSSDRVLFVEALQIGTEFSGTIINLAAAPDTPIPVEALSIVTAFSGSLENV